MWVSQPNSQTSGNERKSVYNVLLCRKYHVVVNVPSELLPSAATEAAQAAAAAVPDAAALGAVAKAATRNGRRGGKGGEEKRPRRRTKKNSIVWKQIYSIRNYT